MALVVRPSHIHSVGVFTTTASSQRRAHRGIRRVRDITPEEADRLYDGAPRTYLYGLRTAKRSLMARGWAPILNHSCDPNCEIDEIKNRAWIFALRDIAAGEELLWDYNLYDDDDPAPCHCGSPKCRGTMYSQEWMAKMRRKARRKSAKRR